MTAIIITAIICTTLVTITYADILKTKKDEEDYKKGKKK